MSVWPSGAAVTSACEATTPPAPGRFSTMTDWPHCRETTSPSVRATISTPPPGAYGTKICTGLDGNSGCAKAATPPAANIAVAATAVRSRRPNNHLLKAPPPDLLVSAFIAHLPTTVSGRSADHV